ncbi:MAG: chemotaxis protein CheR [Treponema sp. GWB1_62_6]|nr:MAG: chemotaxis protein CheR [Treponema sp. GWA1_62_8]OHE63163.1 MAG: chemotaxis protein CheR [Treponema sp. GWB1_62_6]OHE69367.1 MAG: chemotaxis protein CheR [Treponema sp. GWC1_61_84]HCM25334.1 chemotaxis protein CheR [Treponema sp.]
MAKGQKPPIADAAAPPGTHSPHGTEKPFPIVGIGASAGGLAAFEAFFSGMPAETDPGMAFVLVQHLAPDHKSILTDLISRYTRMQVFEVEDGMRVRPNCAYIIPPGRDMAFLNGTLQLMEPSAPRGQRLPIDFFFRSLAQDQRERAIGIVLSGTGSDGTLGIRAIKGEGGMAIAQDPDSLEYDGMPRSAIATDLVDFVLPPADMPACLIDYTMHAFGLPSSIHPVPEQKAENALKKIFILLRSQTGHDFSQYKPSTVNRRIERRMAVQRIDSIDEYVKFLQRTPKETDALFRDLLIGVTSFFRDPEAFRILKELVVPRLFSEKIPGAAIRVWVPGCSTGEEPYSIAMLLQERMEEMKQHCKAVVFATDIDGRAIAAARAGVYPPSIAADLSPDRLARFFTVEPGDGTFRVRKDIRDMLVFSEQDLIKDPPFSRLDLISCRNLLIYMGGDLQKKIIPLFHYAMNPGGVLFLGTSESVGEFVDIFDQLDGKAKLYRSGNDPRGRRQPGRIRFIPSALAEGTPGHGVRKPTIPVKPPLRELAEQAILQQFAPTAVLVDGKGDILYLHGRAGRYLELVPGVSTVNNILGMAREGLRQDLAAALREAAAAKEVVHRPRVRMKTDDSYGIVSLAVRPVAAPRARETGEALYLVLLEEAPPEPVKVPQAEPARTDGTGAGERPDADARISALELELRAKDEFIRTTSEELETSNEELRSSNEEMQSVNEELQSTNEELETSKEELQSVNEELSTVNAELQSKVIDLSQANNDMNNLLAGTGIGTVFVDHALRILRFTPAAKSIINLIPGDVGRPVAHLASNLEDYDRLTEDARSVLDTLIPFETEVRSNEGKWYSMRIQPYRTLENVIEGAVITFVEITAIREAQVELMKANEKLRRLSVVVRDSSDAITVLDFRGRILAWNPGAERAYGWSEAEALSMNIGDMIPAEFREEELGKLPQLIGAGARSPYRTRRIAKDGRIVEVLLTATALADDAGRIYGVSTTERLYRGEDEK